MVHRVSDASQILNIDRRRTFSSQLPRDGLVGSGEHGGEFRPKDWIVLCCFGGYGVDQAPTGSIGADSTLDGRFEEVSDSRSVIGSQLKWSEGSPAMGGGVSVDSQEKQILLTAKSRIEAGSTYAHRLGQIFDGRPVEPLLPEHQNGGIEHLVLVE